MADRFKKRGPRARNFIRQWREHREMSQNELAEAMSELARGKGITGVSVSRTERGLTPYNQDFLEVAAVVLECSPAELISRDPRTAPESQIEQAIRLLQDAQTRR